ncbi:acyltransferase domain-containing protein, partial [Streptomyces sp. HNM0575]|uniref:type I polyketide synthase n=1 Tax=Streptomyces sp. HNM0575 TaxID=2716338 RepID=UPI00145F62A9
GLTAPNGPSQQRVIRQALSAAGLAASDVDAVEAHGTGTALGDPIEAQALLSTYGQERESDRPLLLGSVKSNLGHTQAAAGVAGVIKMVEALRHGELPRTLHVDSPSSHVEWDAGAVELLRERVAWPQVGRVRRAGVSSFGISGTNAHVILEQAPVSEPGGESDSVPDSSDSVSGSPDSVSGSVSVLPDSDVPGSGFGGVVPWVVSGRSEGALDGQLGRLESFVGGVSGGVRPVDVGFSLMSSRSVFEHRAVVVREVESGEGSVSDSGGVSSSVSSSVCVRGVVGEVGSGPVFVFPGQGSQWVGMAVELLDSSPVFGWWMGECDRVVGGLAGFSVVGVLRDSLGGGAGVSVLERIEVLQPVLFSVMVSLAELWRSCGVVPSAVVGSSQGEIAAAYVAGVLSLEDAARVVVLRSGLFARELVGGGAVASVALPVGRVRGLLEGWSGRLSLAGVNGPSAVTVAGELGALEEFVSVCEERGVRARVVGSSVASHSVQVEPLREELLGLLEGVECVSGGVPLYSTVSGGVVDGGELGVEYWFANAREPVDFAGAVRSLVGDGYRVFVECSAHPVLMGAVEETAEESGVEVVALGSLRRGQGGGVRFVTSLAEAWVRGVPVEWGRLFEGSGARSVELPTYAFQRERFWPKAPVVVEGGSHPVDAALWGLVESADDDVLARVLGVDSVTARQVASGLVEWRGRERVRSRTGGWCYRESWKPLNLNRIDTTSLNSNGSTPESPDADSAVSGVWLVVVPAGGGVPVGWVSLVVGLLGAGVVCLEVEEGVERAVLAARVGEVLPSGGECAGVLSFLPVGDGGVGSLSSGVSGVPGGLWGSAVLVQALGDAGVVGPVWGVTCGAVAAVPGDVVVHPVQAAVWGLGRVAALELPHRWGGLVDLPADPDSWNEEIGRGVAGLLASGAGEDQVAVRDTGIYGRRLVPTEL